MRRRLQYRQYADEGELINLTPLLDVLFVVLILFILISPLLNVDEISLSSGGVPKGSTIFDNHHPIKIYVKEDNSIWLANENLDLDRLAYQLKNFHLAYPQAPCELYHDQKATFGTYQNIKKIVEATGFETLNVILHE